MATLSVGVFRNTLWSLQFTPSVQVLFATMSNIDFTSLEAQIRSFATHQTFQVGPLIIEKHRNSQVCLTFPGLIVTPNKWLVCASGNPHQRTIDMNMSDLQMLLEFLVHMRDQY